jgi:cholesterol transport system auxiliary component
MRCLAVLAAVSLLAACAGPGSSPAHRYFVLEAPSTAAAVGAPKVDATLLVAPTSAAAFYDTQEIVFSRSAGTRAYYQFSSWTEPPSRRLATLLASRLEHAGSFRTAVMATSNVRGSLLLRTHLEELYHDATTPPGVARVTLTAELSDPAKGRLLGRRTFSVAAPVASYDADGAVRGLSQALAMLLDDVSEWVIGTAVE